MNAMFPEGGTLAVDPDDDQILAGMSGMEVVQNMLWNVLVKPRMSADLYARTYGRMGALHFAIAGPDGSGKRTAIRRACSFAGVTMLTIGPNGYVAGDIERAIQTACRSQPALICFAEYEELLTRPCFSDEFRIQVLLSAELCGTWDRVWLAFCVGSAHVAKSPPLARLVGNRVAPVAPFDGPTARRILIDQMLPIRHIPLLEPLKLEQVRTLETAAAGCTASELRAFAEKVVLRALSRHDMADLASESGSTTVHGTVPEARRRRLRETPKDRNGGNGDDDDLFAASSRTEGGTTAAELWKMVVEDPPLDQEQADTLQRDTGYRRLGISWARDAEPLYVVVETDLGSLKRIIPHFEKRPLE